jgi:hypothetical protein
MVKAKTVEWAIIGLFGVWYLLGSGKGFEYTQNIVRMPKEYQYQKYLSEQDPLTRWLMKSFYGSKLQWD